MSGSFFQAIAWGGLSHELFASGKRYQWVAWAYLVGIVVPVPFWLAHKRWPGLRLDYLYTPVICYYIGWLCVGINSSILSYFAIAWFSQWYLRTRCPRWFAKYNYILAAGASSQDLRMRTGADITYARSTRRWDASHGVHPLICSVWCGR